MTFVRTGVCWGPALFFLALVACGHGGTGVTNPERRSESEYDLARDYFYRGQPREALDHCLKAVEFDDENAKALYFTSTIYLFFCSGNEGNASSDCKLDQAETFARRALKQDPEFRDSRNLLGQVLILENKFKEAITVLEPLVKDPSYNASYLAWGNLGWAEVQDGQVDKGIASLRNSITQPKFCVGYYRLGKAFEKKNDLAQAEQSYTKAVQVESPDCQSLQDAWKARGEVRLRQGNQTDACADLARCKEISVETQAGKGCVDAMAKSACTAAAPK